MEKENFEFKKPALTEENPFENEAIANRWIEKVESESGRARDKEIYPRIQKWISEIHPQKVLEIGAGQGICSDKLGDDNVEYIGIDSSNILIDRAHQKYQSPKRTFVCANAYNVPLENESVDGVFSNNVWFHLGDVEKASAEMARVLKIGGSYLIITRNPETYDVLETFFRNSKKEGKKIEGPYIVPGGDIPKSVVYLHSMDEIEKALSENNLSIDKIEYFGSTLHKNVFMVINGKKK